jgi:HSP20 family protein
VSDLSGAGFRAEEVRKMALVPWRPFTELDRLRGEMDRLFSDFFGRGSALTRIGKGGLFDTQGWTPPVDMIDRPDEIVVKTMVPGMEKKDINVSVSNGTLTVSGERKTDSEVKEEDYYCCEQSYGKFYRAVDLPSSVESEKVKATLKNGILEIHLPKAEAVKPKSIEVVEE